MAVIKIKPMEHVQFLNDETKKDKYYYHVPFGDRPWVGIDKTGDLKSGQFASESDLAAFLGVEALGVEIAQPVAHTTVDGPERVHNDQVAEAVREEIARTPDAEALSPPITEPPVVDTNGAAPGFVRCNRCSMDYSDGGTPDFDHKRNLCPKCAEKEDFPYMDLTDDELKAKISEAETAWFQPFRIFAKADSEYTALVAKLETENEALLERRKAAKERKEARAKDLKLIASEYFRRNPTEKKFDVYVTAKEFKTIELDEPLAMEWAKASYPAAILERKETLDHGRVETYIKDLVKRKEPVPKFATFKSVTEVQLSSKVPEETT